MSTEEHEPKSNRSTYEVGHRKPPKANQFQKRRSSNPGGQSKRSKGGNSAFEQKYSLDLTGLSLEFARQSPHGQSF